MNRNETSIEEIIDITAEAGQTEPGCPDAVCVPEDIPSAPLEEAEDIEALLLAAAEEVEAGLEVYAAEIATDEDSPKTGPDEAGPSPETASDPNMAMPMEPRHSARDGAGYLQEDFARDDGMPRLHLPDIMKPAPPRDTFTQDVERAVSVAPVRPSNLMPMAEGNPPSVDPGVPELSFGAEMPRTARTGFLAALDPEPRRTDSLIGPDKPFSPPFDAGNSTGWQNSGLSLEKLAIPPLAVDTDGGDKISGEPVDDYSNHSLIRDIEPAERIPFDSTAKTEAESVESFTPDRPYPVRESGGMELDGGLRKDSPEKKPKPVRADHMISLFERPAKDPLDAMDAYGGGKILKEPAAGLEKARAKPPVTRDRSLLEKEPKRAEPVEKQEPARTRNTAGASHMPMGMEQGDHAVIQALTMEFSPVRMSAPCSLSMDDSFRKKDSNLMGIVALGKEKSQNGGCNMDI